VLGDPDPDQGEPCASLVARFELDHRIWIDGQVGSPVPAGTANMADIQRSSYADPNFTHTEGLRPGKLFAFKIDKKGKIGVGVFVKRLQHSTDSPSGKDRNVVASTGGGFISILISENRGSQPVYTSPK